jgi:ATPase subunit of ABC transporter with duplicated ATPase domains
MTTTEEVAARRETRRPDSGAVTGQELRAKPQDRGIISIRDLSKTYATGQVALKTVNLDIRKGEIFALLGPNGAGKTTLINIVCGIVTASTGHILADGHDIAGDYRQARMKIGLVPQELTTDRFVRDRHRHGYVQPRTLRPPKEPRVHREDSAGTGAVGQTQRSDPDAVGRHEAALDDRQSTVPRTDHPLSR